MWRIAALVLLACAGCAANPQSHQPSWVPTTGMLQTSGAFFKDDNSDYPLPAPGQNRTPGTAR